MKIPNAFDCSFGIKSLASNRHGCCTVWFIVKTL